MMSWRNSGKEPDNKGTGLALTKENKGTNKVVCVLGCLQVWIVAKWFGGSQADQSKVYYSAAELDWSDEPW
jgi:hypothetical protein